MKDEAPSRRAGVDLVVDRLKADTTVAELFNRGQQVRQRTATPVEAPDTDYDTASFSVTIIVKPGKSSGPFTRSRGGLLLPLNFKLNLVLTASKPELLRRLDRVELVLVSLC